ncbi:ABC transporter permease [Solitalea canadensis]|uniref:ABC-type dipeptide/oligopeptide/nickel transport system, permease component n=1 Tax=Solitalea canadensis (strain ATCC 29591 / DSM 3403 / JCM 21819 / LMG 8368 / NBRC 15130 / NCIMB 12057 / USAM 9D) TaxID=929556 RepID=H8KWQ7_SOLCM|nr:ABC transporter permease [Solitalea canadensis]AFD08236.1 ABC-type dipeptide/oligopeptide/nickel transport system, permease component [Solitalea canadensis DSM 3403]
MALAIAPETPWQRTKKRFLRNKLSVFGLVVIAFFVLISFLGYLITPDDTPMSNRMNVQLSTKHPGSTFKFLSIRKNQQIDTVNVFTKLFFGQPDFFDFVPINSFKFNADSIIIDEYTGISGDEKLEKRYSLADVVYPLQAETKVVKDGEKITFTTIYGQKKSENIADLQKKITSENIVNRKYWLGTDLYGRDMLSRLILGSRISLSVGFMSVLISLVIGIALGALAGYYGGWLDQFISWLINVVWSLPSLLIVIAISFALGKGFFQVFIAIGLTTWVDVARMVRGQIMGIREVEYVEAGRAMGFSNARIIIRHILPNISGPILVVASANFASAILLEAGLSFLGFGVQPPFPSWGGMIKEHYGYIIIDAAYLAVLPGLAIMLIVYAFNLVSVGLTDAFNVRSQTSG